MITALPRGWAWATVDDLARYVNGVAFKPSDWEKSGRPIIRIQNLTGKAEFNHTTRPVSQDVVVHEGDILVSWSATLDVFVWRGPEAVLNQHIFRVIPASSLRDYVFLRWALKNAIEELWASEHSHGTTMKHVNRGPFLEHGVKLPPAPEQRRVADALESYFSWLDDAVATLERAQRNLKRYRASVLKAAVEGRLVPTEAELARAEGRSYEPASVLLTRVLAERRGRWEEAELAKLTAKGKAPKDDKWKAKYVEPVAPGTGELPELPEGWCWTTAEALSDETRSITYGVVKLGHVTPGGVLTLRSSNVRHLRLDLEYVKPIARRVSDGYRRTVLRGDEVLVTVRGTLGGVAATSATCVGFNISREVAMIALVEPSLSSLVTIFIASDALQSWIMQRTRGIAYTGINIGTLKELPIPLPPLAEQRRIVEAVDRKLSVGAAIEGTAIASVRRCHHLRRSILKWAFEGRLVDQDPTDEPASVLLDRIRAERASATDKPPRARSARATKKQGS